MALVTLLYKHMRRSKWLFQGWHGKLAPCYSREYPVDPLGCPSPDGFSGNSPEAYQDNRLCLVWEGAGEAGRESRGERTGSELGDEARSAGQRLDRNGALGARGSCSNCLGWQPAIGLRLCRPGCVQGGRRGGQPRAPQTGPWEEQELEGTPVAPALPSNKCV